MRLTSRITFFVLLLAALSLFWFLLGSLNNGYNASQPSLPEYQIPTGQGAQQVSGAMYGQSNIWVVMLYLIVPLTIASFLLWRSRKGRKEELITENPKSGFVWAILAFIIVVFMFFIPDIIKAISNVIFPMEPLFIVESPLLLIPLAILFFFLGFRYLARLDFSSYSFSTSSTLKKTLNMQTLEDAFRYRRFSAGDLRDFVLEDYRVTCEFLSKVGRLDLSKLTARELEILAVNMFGLDSSLIHELTLLFEKARYSKHKVTEDDVLKARLCSRAIINYLKTKAKVDL
jgi:hypothetical protein